MAANNPHGPRIIEGGWGGSLILPGGLALEGSNYLHTHLFDGVRIMAKAWEYVHNRQRFESHTMARVRAAKALGIKIQLSIDIHNSADDSSEYHNERKIPRNFQRVVKEILLLIDPDEIEVINEPYATTNLPGPGNYGRKLTMKQYKNDFFNVYAEAARQANWNGLFLAWQDHPDQSRRPNTPGNFQRDSWIWHGEWDNCAEVLHDFVLDRRSTDPDVFAWQIESKMYSLENPGDEYPREYAVGWQYGIFQNEHSSVGRQVHINSRLGARLCETSWDVYKKEKCAWGFLTIGGATDDYGDEGGWRMNTDLICNGRENPVFSLGCLALMQRAGVEVPDLGEPPIDPPIDPPVDPPDNDGPGYAYLTKAEGQIVRAKKHWGKRRGIRHADRAIGHLETAIGRSE